MTTLFITGIDTDIGKSIACGALTSTLLTQGHHVFTQKWIETGCDNVSEDLLTHQKIAKKVFNTSQKDLHSPYRFSYPASPHLAAELEKISIDCDYLVKQTKQLEAECDHLIIEGAGGLCVPLNQSMLTVDLITQEKIPVVLVTSGRLGSINHTVLSLELCRQREIEVRALVYNHFPVQEDPIFSDTRKYLKNYLIMHNMEALWLEMPANAEHLDLSTEQINQLLDLQ